MVNFATKITITPIARRTVTPSRIDRMNFRAGDGCSDPARKETDRGDGSFLVGDTVALALERLLSWVSLVGTDRESSFSGPHCLDWLPLLSSRGFSMGTATATERSSRLVIDPLLFRTSFGSVTSSVPSPRSRVLKGSES